MIVREIVYKDIDDCVVLLKEHYNNSACGGLYDFDSKHVSFVVYGWLSNPNVIKVVVIYKDEIVGVGVLEIFPTIMNPRQFHTNERALYASSKLSTRKRLEVINMILDEFERQTQGRVNTIDICVPAKNAMGKILKRRGFALKEHYYVKAVL